MARIWNTPIFILATVYFVVDGVFSYVTQPISGGLQKRSRSSAREFGSLQCGLTRRWPSLPSLSLSWNPPSL
jgi:hypothetical protein